MRCFSGMCGYGRSVHLQIFTAMLVLALTHWKAVARSPAIVSNEASRPMQPVMEEEEESNAVRGVTLSTRVEPPCDVYSDSPICYSGGEGSNRHGILLPNAVAAGLVGRWTFDEESALDSSGSANHGTSAIVHGPSFTGGGHSAYFQRNFLSVPNSAQFQFADFTYSFWVYLLEHPAASEAQMDFLDWCPLLRKGIEQKATALSNSYPALLYSSRTGHLRIKITTAKNDLQDEEVAESNARLLPDQWTHMAIVYHRAQARFMLYVNGILDTAMSVQGLTKPNDFPLYVGGDPFTQDNCGIRMYIDELRAYSRPVHPHELRAEAASALGGTDPYFVRLGCLSCSLQEVVNSCPTSRHVCTSLELHTGGYQVARSLGWLRAAMHVWTHAAVVAELGPEGTAAGSKTMGLGLCCEGSAP